MCVCNYIHVFTKAVCTHKAVAYSCVHTQTYTHTDTNCNLSHHTFLGLAKTAYKYGVGYTVYAVLFSSIFWEQGFEKVREKFKNPRTV